MEGPPRANAAQLAARKIKEKPKRTRTTTSRPDLSSAPQWPNSQPQAMNGAGSGGLFGGSVPTGSFSFTPSGGPSFPPSTFGGGNNNNIFGGPSTEVSDQESDRPVSDRPAKKQFGVSSSTGNQQNGSLFSTSNIFGNGQSTNIFGSGNPQQGGSNIFSGFGGTSQALSGASISFPPPTPQSQPSSNLFSFPPTTSASPSFGSTPASNDTGTSLFTFSQQTPSQPAAQNSPFKFTSQSTEPKPANSPFVFGQAASQSSSSGTSFNSVEAPTHNVFGKPRETQPPNMFGTNPQQSAQTNIFGSTTTPAQPSNLFGDLKPTVSQPASIFSSREQSPAKEISNIFGGQIQQPAQNPVNIFGNLNQPSAPSQISEELRLEAPSKAPEPPKSPAPANRTLFGSPKPTPPLSNPFGNTNSTTAQNNNEPLKNLNQPLDQSSPQKSNGAGLFPSGGSGLSNGNTSSVLTNGATSSSLDSESHSSAPETGPAPAAVPMKPDLTRSPLWDQPPYATSVPHTAPIASLMQKLDDDSGESIARPPDAPKSPEQMPTFLEEISNNTFIPLDGNKEDYPKLFPGMLWASQIPIARMKPQVPPEFNAAQTIEYYTAYRMRELNNALARYFKRIQVTDNVIPAINFYQSRRAEILGRGGAELKEEYAKLKRKAAESEDQENEHPSKRMKQDEPSFSSQQSIGPTDGAQEDSSEPEKPSQPYLNGNANTMLNSAAGNPQPANPQPAPAPSKGKRRGEDLTKDDYEASMSSSPLKRAKLQKTNGSSSGSATSNLFKQALDSPAKPSPSRRSPEKPLASPKKAADDMPRFNPFGNLPVPASSAGSQSTAPTSSNLFGSSLSTKATQPSSSPSKHISAPLFALSGPSEQKATGVKPPTFGSVPSNFMSQFAQKANENEDKLLKKAMDEDYDSDDDKEEWIANWRKKRAAEKKEIEALAKSKRTTFVPGEGFAFGKANETPTSDTSEKEAQKSQLSTASKPLFGQATPSQSSGNSVFSTLNGSRTSTPGPFSSGAASVLDSHTPGKPVSFGGNIFAHLSDADSGGDNGKGNDADDESADEDTESDAENKDPSYKPGEESKSGPGTPAEETGPGIASAKKATTPFTFGSSKSVFGGGSNSGTSSPGTSIFDRLQRDSNGKPQREISSEEKENTQPNTTNIFGEVKNPFASLNKSSANPADQTWKPDSPIKFGSTTPSNDAKNSAPAVNVQAATPTKSSSPFGNLFGNATDSKPALSNGSGSSTPFTNLFGSAGAAKPATTAGVGFNFGTTSTSSSLFPSAAVSATTSRATTPGATTDGDSGVEGDPDAERHEQIDLTAGGPGEEDEEVLHEVRAKALKFNTKGDGQQGTWDTKGVGPLRVLKHKDTKASRILLRADPSGTIVLNKALLAQVKYEPTVKTIKLLTAADNGKGLETWILQVKTPELAEGLAKVLESNKPS